MSSPHCAVPECTYAETGVCLRGYASPGECPSFQLIVSGDGLDGEEHEVVPVPARDLGGEVLDAPSETVLLPRSDTLSVEDANELMEHRYASLIGVFGLPDSGKTASIVSLYLLLSSDRLRGYSFAGSRSLMALDEIARGARRWDESSVPSQMTLRTQLSNDRQAGFLHLRLLRKANLTKVDLLIPDLPGEWTQTMIQTGDSIRFNFLGSADVIWVLVDGRKFAAVETRQLAVHQTTLLLERIVEAFAGGRLPRVILVSSWKDTESMPSSVEELLRSSAAENGIVLEFVSIASFSQNPEVPPGDGIAALLDASLKVPDRPDAAWPSDLQHASVRNFLRFGTNL